MWEFEFCQVTDIRGPKPLMVELADDGRQGLETLARGHTTAEQIALRARMTLLAVDGQNNAQIAR